MSINDLKNITNGILSYIGEDCSRDGLVDFEKSFKKTLDHFFSGYSIDISKIFERPIKNQEYNDEIIIENIDFISMCEHHFLPFFGNVSIRYTPSESILGIGRFRILVESISRKLQIQERMTKEIGDAIMLYLNPKILKVSISAEHFCTKFDSKNALKITTSYQK